MENGVTLDCWVSTGEEEGCRHGARFFARVRDPWLGELHGCGVSTLRAGRSLSLAGVCLWQESLRLAVVFVRDGSEFSVQFRKWSSWSVGESREYAITFMHQYTINFNTFQRQKKWAAAAVCHRLSECGLASCSLCSFISSFLTRFLSEVSPLYFLLFQTQQRIISSNMLISDTMIPLELRVFYILYNCNAFDVLFFPHSLPTDLFKGCPMKFLLTAQCERCHRGKAINVLYDCY